MIALACSAAFPTIGSKMTLIKATDIFNDSDAPCNRPETQDAYGSTRNSSMSTRIRMNRCFSGI